jgi:hypothetical protein
MRKFPLWCVICAFGALVLASFPARAQENPLCRADLRDQMFQRARLHAHMDSTTVQNLVYKPDSVLEYSCFDRFLDVVVRYGSGAGTATEANNRPGVEATDRFYAFNPYYTNEIVRRGVTDYININFGHNYMGGRYTGADPAPASQTEYTCDVMARVWQAARCLNFASQDPQEHFYDLSAFVAAPDIRRFPEANCTTPAPAQFGTVPATTTTVVTANLPTNATDCGVAIPTGFVIEMPRETWEGQNRPERYNEYVCQNPTCIYVPTGLTSGDCVANPN